MKVDEDDMGAYCKVKLTVKYDGAAVQKKKKMQIQWSTKNVLREKDNLLHSKLFQKGNYWRGISHCCWGGSYLSWCSVIVTCLKIAATNFWKEYVRTLGHTKAEAIL